MKNHPAILNAFFWAVLLGVTALAAAHHGNPQTPTSPPWYESPLPGHGPR